MGEIRRRRYKFCTVCGCEQVRACRVAGHPFEFRTWRNWWIRYCRDGRRYEESAHTDKWEVARGLLRTREGEIAKGAPITAVVGRFRFEDAAKDIETDYEVNQRRSMGDLKRRITLHLAPYFAGRRMSSITTSDVRAYTSQRLEAGAAQAANREFAILKRMFTLAITAHKLVFRPHIPMLAENNVRTGFFEREEFERVRAHLPAPVRPVVTFAYLTGWRIRSEALPLQWRHVDLNAGIVRLEPGTTKNKEGRVFPFAALPELRSLLQDQRRATTAIETDRHMICRWVFHRNGRRIKSFRTAWTDACKAGKVDGRIPHDFRRTAVRNLERARVSRSVAMKLTGHKTESVYRRYAIVSESDLFGWRDEARQIGDWDSWWDRTRKGQGPALPAKTLTRHTRRTSGSGPGWRNWQTHRT